MTDAFLGLADAGASAFGLPDMRRMVLKHPVNTLGPAELADLQKRAMAEIVRRMTEA